MNWRRITLALLVLPTVFMLPSALAETGKTPVKTEDCEPLLLGNDTAAILQAPADLLLRRIKIGFKDMVANSFAKAADIRSRRQAWRKSHPKSPNSAPIPELKPTVGYFRAILIERLKAQGEGATPEVRKLITSLIDRGEAMIKQNVPYDTLNPYSAEFSTALVVLANNSNVSPESAETIAQPLMQPIADRPDWWFNGSFGSGPLGQVSRQGFEDIRDFVVPVPFGIGFKSLATLWISGIYPAGVLVPSLDWYYTGRRAMTDPETFEAHDYGHWSVQRQMRDKMLAPDKIEILDKKFKQAITQADTKYLAKFGLSEADRAHFEFAINVINYVNVHEDEIPFGRKTVQAEGNLLYFETFENHPENALGDNWKDVTRAALDWYNGYWAKNGI